MKKANHVWVIVDEKGRPRTMFSETTRRVFVQTLCCYPNLKRAKTYAKYFAEHDQCKYRIRKYVAEKEAK